VAFFSKKGRTSHEEIQGTAGTEEVIDTVAEFLRIFGRLAVSSDLRPVNELQGLCVQWAYHLSHGAPAPGAIPEDELIPVKERSWMGAQRFFEAQRQLERDRAREVDDEVTKVQARADELDSTLRDIALALRGVVKQDESADGMVQENLDELKQSASDPSVLIDELRARVYETIELVRGSIADRQKRYNEHMNRMGRELVEIKAELEQKSEEAERDALTGLFNRGSMDRQLEKTLGLCQMAGRPSCLLMLDIDDFKTVNDTFGHGAGDVALKAVADVLSSVVLRKSDFVARYGGDEFIVILNNCRLAAGQMIADRLLQSVVELQLEHEGQDFSVSVSVGVAEMATSDTANGWAQRADANLLKAKEAGKGCIR
jgi:diguanylate cyclase